MLRRPSFPTLPELTTIISVRGVREEIGGRDEESDKNEVKGETLILIHNYLRLLVTAIFNRLCTGPLA